MSLFIFRLPANLMIVFGVAALLLAAVGLYGVLAYLVAQRAQEVGIRVALGARDRDIVGLVLRRAFLLSGSGILLGTGAAAMLGRVMASVLAGVQGITDSGPRMLLWSPITQ